MVAPVKTGVQMVCNCLKSLDSGFRRNDGKRYFLTFYKLRKNETNYNNLSVSLRIIISQRYNHLFYKGYWAVNCPP